MRACISCIENDLDRIAGLRTVRTHLDPIKLEVHERRNHGRKTGKSDPSGCKARSGPYFSSHRAQSLERELRPSYFSEVPEDFGFSGQCLTAWAQPQSVTARSLPALPGTQNVAISQTP